MLLSGLYIVSNVRINVEINEIKSVPQIKKVPNISKFGYVEDELRGYDKEKLIALVNNNGRAN